MGRECQERFTATDFKGYRKKAIRHASRHVRQARTVMHVGIANLWWRGKCSRHSRHMRNPQFYVSGKRPMGAYSPDRSGQIIHINLTYGVRVGVVYTNTTEFMVTQSLTWEDIV